MAGWEQMEKGLRRDLVEWWRRTLSFDYLME